MIAIVEWEQYQENDLRKRVTLIHKIVSVVNQVPEQKLEIC
jgi:hypothetical protein